MTKEFNLQDEVLRLVSEARDVHLDRAKAAYIRRVETHLETFTQQLLVGATGPYDKAYPELEQWALARCTDIAMDVSSALATLMARELASHKGASPVVPVAGENEQAESRAGE